MNTEKRADIAIVGAGIVGLSLAYAAARKGQKVVVFERTPRPLGASIRNFGMIWPIGQAPGKTHQRAMRSRQLWSEVAAQAGFWVAENGSMHLAYHYDEMNVLAEFAAKAEESGYEGCKLLGPNKVMGKSRGVRMEKLHGGLWSPTEMTVDPREVVRKLPEWLQTVHGVEFHFGKAVTHITAPHLEAGGETWQADKIYVCSGSDFETLYPQVFADSGITKCKLQMMRTKPQPRNWSLGPSLCAGLTLRHYASFRDCASLPALSERITRESPDFSKWGIHVLLAQNAQGELVIGDSHEYGLAPDPFDREDVNQIILKYLHTFSQAPNFEIAERWNGVYSSLKDQTEFIAHPEKGVTIVNGLGGAGMTLSFGLAEELLESHG